jgi:hypothetical protein
MPAPKSKPSSTTYARACGEDREPDSASQCAPSLAAAVRELAADQEQKSRPSTK